MKSDQVSVTGTVDGVLRARAALRVSQSEHSPALWIALTEKILASRIKAESEVFQEHSLIVVSLDIPWFLPSPPPLPTLLPQVLLPE